MEVGPKPPSGLSMDNMIREAI